jgi:arginyl-tRNA synthetase
LVFLIGFGFLISGELLKKKITEPSRPNGQKVMVEFSSPNTNKPLHLGHIRNILLGWSCSRILEANGYEVIKTQVVNDRGIAICKSMLAWQKFGGGRTPESAGIKVIILSGSIMSYLNRNFRRSIRCGKTVIRRKPCLTPERITKFSKEQFFKNFKNTYFNEYSPLGAEARRMLLDWEAGGKETLDLWRKLNNWVYQGFNITYDKLGVSFDKLYYESDTYLLGKKAVDYGLSKGVFYQLEDGSVWIDLEDVGMDKKLVLRSDGTAVYMTQDIGTAQKRYEDFGINAMVYTVADEQDYHFKVLFEILRRLGEPYAEHLHHLSYGMVDLPTGKMKSREGTVVDADDLIDEVTAEAATAAADRGELAHLT